MIRINKFLRILTFERNNCVVDKINLVSRNYQIVTGKQVEKLYDRIDSLVKRVDIEDPSSKNKDWMKEVLEVIFVVEPVQEESIFVVDSNVEKRLKELDFKLDSYAVEPFSGFNGNSYKIKTLALSDDGRFYYENKLHLSNNPPVLRVEKSIIKNSKRQKS